jgi:seryl-tRNA synthetase
MSRDFDDIYKKIDQSHKDLYKQDVANSKDICGLKKDQDKLLKDINEIKKEVRDISYKVDIMLEILNSFTIMLDEEELDEDYDTDQTWVPDEDDEWNNKEDDS